LGDALKEGENVTMNPLVLWAWAGLLINGINCIPVGELDGGRISQALWGRKVCMLQLDKDDISMQILHDSVVAYAYTIC
jgi:membrane-associated protease RseP (regulator of RpoE activity)